MAGAGKPRFETAKMTFKMWNQQISIPDVAASAAGLGLTLWAPNVIVKDTTTNLNKGLKLALCLGLTFGVGSTATNFVGQKAGAAAFYGALAGSIMQGLSMFGVLKPVGPAGTLQSHGPASMLPSGRMADAIPTQQRQGEQVTLIRP